MADLRIVDAPVLLQESITDDVKMPTGGLGNFSVRLGDILWYVITKEQLANKNYVDLSSKGVKDSLDEHISDKANPHQVTKAQVGLGNVDNTADVDKPVSNAVNSAIITATNDMATKAYVNSKDGDLTTLTTTDKTSLVKAINEVVSVKADKEDVALSVSNLTNNKADKATTLEGYGIADAYTKSEIDTNYGGVKTLYDKTVTVGASSADFTTINAALTELSKYKKVYIADNSFSNSRAKILLKSGFVAAEQININGQDFGWIDIVSEDAEVVISRQALTQKVGRWYSFLRVKNGVMPSIKTLFSMDKTGTASGRVALYMIQGVGFIEENCGFKNSGERNADITQCSILSCGRGIFTGAEVLNFRPATGSRVFMQYADVSNAPTGLSTSTSANVAAENIVAKNCSSVAVSVQNALIDLTAAELQGNHTGLSALSGGVINAPSIKIAECDYGINAGGAVVINAEEAVIQNNRIVGILANSAASINAKRATITSNAVGVISGKGAVVDVSNANINLSTSQSISAQSGGKIIAEGTNYRKDMNNDSSTDMSLSAYGTIIALNSTGGVSQKSDIATEKGIVVKGIRSRTSGTVVIPQNASYVTINHSLGGIPSVTLVSPNANLGTDISWWVGVRTATTFQISTSAALAQATLFYWSAEL